MADEEQLRVVRQGIVVWSAWREHRGRERPGNQQIDLSEANLGEANLARANLREADLVRAKAFCELVGTPLPICRGGGVYGWSILDGPARPRAGGGGGG